jgi:hypothetical protein
MAWLDGDKRRAERLWAHGLAAAQRLAMPYEQAMLHYDMGRLAGRRRAVADARDLFGQIGATYHLAQTRDALLRAQ